MNIQAISRAQQSYMLNKRYANTPSSNPVGSLDTEQNANQVNPSFKGLGDFIGRVFGEHYAKRMLDAKWTRNLAEWLTKAPGSMTEHMATLGSLITSSVYMGRTLSNKELENDKKKTLAINQFLCFLIPTAAAYTVNSVLAGVNKKLEHKYSGIQSQKIAWGEISQEKAAEILKKKSDRLKGFKTLATLATFTLIYRYITPVIITPAANWIGGKLNKRSEEKKANEQKSQVAVA